MSDERPSISELLRIEADPVTDFEGAAIRKAAPVLLEIVAAAQAFYFARHDQADPEWVEFAQALAKVRP